MLVAGIIPTMFLIDSWGRRPILIFGGVGMVLCLSSVGGLQYYVDKLPDTSPALKPIANGIFSCKSRYSWTLLRIIYDHAPFTTMFIMLTRFCSCMFVPGILRIFLGSGSLVDSRRGLPSSCACQRNVIGNWIQLDVELVSDGIYST
jgi:hypothetical protein